jgi:hypothetical protein
MGEWWQLQEVYDTGESSQRAREDVAVARAGLC